MNIKQPTKQEILQGVPEGATHYSYENSTQLAAYFKDNFTKVYVPEDLAVWEYWEETWLEEDEVVISLEDIPEDLISLVPSKQHLPQGKEYNNKQIKVGYSLAYTVYRYSWNSKNNKGVWSWVYIV